jgi:uncharacterized protein YndB with AHSA1/START domain
MIDVNYQVNAARRTVGRSTVEAGEVYTLTVSRIYDAEVAEVWDACTSAERLPRWFLPVTGELRVGGRYHLKDNASGTVDTCDPPHGFTATWEFGGEVSWIEVRLTEEGAGRTRLELEHLAPADGTAAEFWTTYGPAATGMGWDPALMGLDLHLSSGQAVDPAQFAEWQASEEGMRYTAACAERWAEADIAFGTPEADARARAERTRKFYTGEQEE